MPTISPEQAAALAEAFVAARPTRRCGTVSSVTHTPAGPERKDGGRYRVEFPYAGPPVRQKTLPPRDHPTIVFVDDETGKCTLMYWM